jgi:phospholipase/lecithinase/hemolysin
MKFTGLLARGGRRLGAIAGLAASALVLASCGGGTEVQRFHPTRIVAFGDEASVITTSGLKYTINALVATNNGTGSTIDCTSNPLWIQDVAGAFGLAFQNCGDLSATGIDLAVPNAKATDIGTQVENFLALAGASRPFSHSDIVTVMAGTHDVLEQYAQYPATPEDTLTGVLKQRADALADTVNQIALSGAPVIVMRIPDVGLTPFGQAQGTDNAAVLSRLTLAFNTELQLHLINDGHLIGIVFGDSQIQSLVTYASIYGIANTTNPACSQASNITVDDTQVLTECTANTLATGATTTSYLWAGNISLSPYGQNQLGQLAASRAINNPF